MFHFGVNLLCQLPCALHPALRLPFPTFLQIISKKGKEYKFKYSFVVSQSCNTLIFDAIFWNIYLNVLYIRV